MQVDALRGQVSGLREELVSRGAVTAQLHAQLGESARQREREVHSITVDRDNIHTKVSLSLLPLVVVLCVHKLSWKDTVVSIELLIILLQF